VSLDESLIDCRDLIYEPFVSEGVNFIEKLPLLELERSSIGRGIHGSSSSLGIIGSSVCRDFFCSKNIGPLSIGEEVGMGQEALISHSCVSLSIGICGTESKSSNSGQAVAEKAIIVSMR
jgi:hypothetical protein